MGLTIRLRAQLSTLDPSTRHAVRRALTLVGLLPASCILALKLAAITGDPWLNAYGIGVLVTTMSVFYVAFTRYDDPSEEAETGGSVPLVSCLVAVKDDVAVIESCVRSLLASDWPSTEVIVVDDGSTDGTADVLERIARSLPITVVTMDRNRGKKAALTEGARRARGTVLAFTDSDCVLAPDAVGRCVRALLADPDLGAVSGHARALNADQSLITRVQDVWYDGQFGVSKAAEASFGAVTCISGPLAVFRREAIVNYLPAWVADRFLGEEFRFATDRQLTGYVLGQDQVGARLQAKYENDPLVSTEVHPTRRWNVGYVRSARVWTNVPTSAIGVLRQQVRWKKSFIRSLFFAGRFYWRRGLLPALLFYGHAIWVVAGPFMAFRHLVWLPLHGAVALALLYMCGVVFKGGMWAAAYAVQNPKDPRWIYRPLMSVASAASLSWLLVWSVLTLRRRTWSREESIAPATVRDSWAGAEP